MRFVYESEEPRLFGRQLVMAKATDTDGIELSITLNLDRSGDLFEVDIWKVDFSPLLALPDPGALVVG